MISIEGKWFDGQTSTQTDAVLRVYDNGAWQLLRVGDDVLLSKASAFEFDISPRLANTPRYLTLPGGGSFETLDNEAVDAALALLRRSHWSLKVYLLESRMRYVLLAMVLFAALAFAGVRYGLPAASKLIVAHLPEAVFEKAGEQTLRILDKMVFAPSELHPDTEMELRRHFQSALDAHPGLRLEVMFRKGGRIGPNAFALPGGQIIFTDEMIALSENNDELLSVLAHEIGHVFHQHGMRRVVQDSLLSFAILAVTGDASGVSELFLGLPVILTELAYSREFENEADQYAMAYMQSHQIPLHHFADILTRISATDKKRQEDDPDEWSSYLSTHPPTSERVAAFREARDSR